jgi:guanylate kinase
MKMGKTKLIVISAPSGSGKTTIAREILKRHPEIVFSVSATTRSKRETEIDGKDYFFLTREEFEKKIAQSELAEWQKIYDDYYGSLKSQIDSALKSGKSMLFDIDVKGSLSIKQKYPNDAVLIFIDPPSIELLTERLSNRKTENAETLHKRLERAPMEIAERKNFDYCVLNNDLQKAVDSVEDIICKELE